MEVAVFPECNIPSDVEGSTWPREGDIEAFGILNKFERAKSSLVEGVGDQFRVGCGRR
jgi:hypothetical protein